ncbi:MAG: hypothetical protein QM632_05195 [Micrococcaceae bacterium]
MDTVKKVGLGKYFAGLLVFVAVFAAAIICAIGQRTVLAWFIAGVAFAWLLLASVVVYTVYRISDVGVRATEHVNTALSQANERNANQMHVVQQQIPDSSQNAEDREKLSHLFQIIETQVHEAQSALTLEDAPAVSRALETIEGTSHMGASLLKK